MTVTHGFELIREDDLREANSTARLYRHVKTGAELLSLINNDENKVFGVTFRTPPADSTGVAHILEHSVLCGSRKYPVKEPFVELIKGSLNTFLNAMTYPDKTCYPVASQNLQDFYNLVDVYLDAVFHPRITENTFRQEGWHYELDAVDAPLTYKGVVFNEMKGAYSSPDSVLGDVSRVSLYPDNTYGIDSGGDPKHIPDLTYEDFKDFHARYYHPANARLFFYGDDDPTERLRILAAYLDEYEPIEVDSAVTLQPRFTTPKRLTSTYVGGKDQTKGKKAMATVNWMLDEPADVEDDLALGILNYILTGTPASPLRKALIDSGLGEALAGAGIEDDLRQPMYSIGLKGIDAGDTDQIEALILGTLGNLADKGIDRSTVDAALNTIEFHLRENNTGSFPRGISLMLRSLGTWLYERDPLAPLAFETPLGAIKAKVAGGERLFEELIRTHFLDNLHRTTVTLTPDPDQAEREVAEERRRLDAARAAMTRDELASVVEMTEKLKRLQETADPPEALAKIPSLRLDDLPRRNKPIPLDISQSGVTPILFHDLPTNGIVYLDVGLDLHRLESELLPFVPLFGRALLETGVGTEDFVALSQRIGRTTGGISPQRWTSAVHGGRSAAAWLFLRSKAVPDRAGELLGILRDVLTEARLDDRERLQQLVLEEKAGLEARLAPMGLRLVDLRLRASLDEADWAAEQMGGVSYLIFLRGLAEDIKTNWTRVQSAFDRIRTTLVDRSSMLLNVTTDAANWRALEPKLNGFLSGLPSSARPVAHWANGASAWSEGFTIPAPVNYVGKGAKLAANGFRPGGGTSVATRYLSTTWLWDKVRVQGGAYGGSCRFDRLTGNFTFLSYRDPNLLATLDVYDQSSAFLKTADLSDIDLTRSIIGTVGDIDRYLLPDAKGFSSMQRYLIGDTEEIRQRFRDEVLAASQADFRGLADALQKVAIEGRVVVLGGEAAIEAANGERQGFLEVSKLL